MQKSLRPKFDYILYADGGSRGNPGPAALGAVICSGADEKIKSYGQYLGEKTNNEAEYEAVIFVLKKLKQLIGGEAARKARVLVRSDSELLVSQMNHLYKIETDHIGKLFLAVWNLMTDFQEVRFEHVPREQNREADRLLNEVLDKKQGQLF